MKPPQEGERTEVAVAEVATDSGKPKPVDQQPTAHIGSRRPRAGAKQPTSTASGSGRHRGDSAPPLDFSKNKRVGRFELIREIARGGMGQVFLGRDTQLGRKVAIKFLLRDDPHFVQRFVIEAKATARCTHENIVTIYEVGEHERLPYMVLEYLEGKTLSEVIRAKPSLRQFIEYLVPVARAVERAHQYGIIHRDLKPSNIFVTDRGQVKVLDFGVARLDADMHEIPRGGSGTEGATALTSTDDSLVGTLPFMSPEQWGAAEVDHLSDVWVFGIMLWQALADTHPAGSMAADNLRVRLLDLHTPFPSIATKNPAIPPQIAAIADKCLAKHKAQRYQNASELLAALREFLDPSDSSEEDHCPYRGLASYGEADAKYFLGRSNEIRTAVAQLEQWPLLAVIGPSGVGKSSFVHAGLIPAVRAHGSSCQVHVLRPGRFPLVRLAAVLERTLQTGEEQSDIKDQLATAPGLFGSMLRNVTLRRQERAIIVVDQLEELFTLCDDETARPAFLAALLAAADDSSSPLRVVLSMRADFLDRLAGHKQFLAELSRGMFFLTTPDHENLRETIERPAEMAGYAFESTSIVDDMMKAASSRGALPLLSFAATRLWDGRDRQRKLLTVDAYHAMGGVGGAFAQHADRVASEVPPTSQPLLRAIMLRLLTPEGTRAVVDQSELLSLAKDHTEAERILDKLVRARLVHFHTEPDQVVTVEIVHEMLITEWPMLRRWIEDGQAMRGFLHELRGAAKQWGGRQRAPELLWQGRIATEALAHAERHLLDLSTIEREFLDAIAAQVKRRRRGRVIAIASIASAVGLVLLGAVIALVKIKLAETAAHDKAEQAAAALLETQAAKNALQANYNVLAEKEAARVKAEGERRAAEDSRRAAEDSRRLAIEAEGLSKEQLQTANKELRRTVVDLQKAEAAAKHATEEAKDAKARAEALLAKERAALEKLKAEKKNIFDGDLTPGGLR